MREKDYAYEEPLLGRMNRPDQWFGKDGSSDYIPGWYSPHVDLEAEVSCEGMGLGFIVKQVLPWRRWAIKEGGEVRQQSEFAELYFRYLSAFKVASTTDLAREYVPNAKDFVSKKKDLNGNLVDIHYVDDGRITKTEKWTTEGEIAPEYIAREKGQDQTMAKLEELTNLLKDNLISRETFAKRAAALGGVDIAEVGKRGVITDPDVKAKRQANMAKARQARKDNVEKRAKANLGLDLQPARATEQEEASPL